MYPSIQSYLQQFREQLEPRPVAWKDTRSWQGRKPGSYKWYEIQDSVDYYEIFDKHNICFSDIANFPRFSWNEQKYYVNNRGYVLASTDISLLGILQSRVCWFCISRLCAPLGERKGLVRYLHFTQYITSLPIPQLTDVQSACIGQIATELTRIGKQRYQVRCKMIHRIQSDLGASQVKPNQTLEKWWNLTFTEFRNEIVKVFKRDISLKDRDDWEELLSERSTKIKQLTEEIIRLETELNKAVYEVFELEDEEIKLIEQETKYQYGEW